MARLDPAVVAHLEWLGFVRPTGLVVSAPALVRAGAILDRRDAEGQRALQAAVEERTFAPKDGPVPFVPDFRAFAESVLAWSFSGKGYAGTDESPIPSDLEVPLPDYGETLRPDFAVRELDPDDDTLPWQLVVSVLDPGQDFDQVIRGNGRLEASPQGRMERLLRQTGVPAGLLFNGRALRLISAPHGESSGWLDFAVTDMVQIAGRPISTALRLLLSQQRLLALPKHQRLPSLLEDSRKFQNEVSERLAEQVLHALYELLRGFQAAHDASGGELLHEPLTEHPDEVYRALLTVILRLVFLLYAEERDMLPEDETFLQYYSLAGLYERLREDASLFPDTMNQRYGAWAQLLVLFRMIYDGAESDEMQLPKRHGVLFDPDRFPFLEGRSSGGGRQIHERIEPPLVPDGTLYRALDKLLVLDGERISYRALDVEQIGSVYETMMGFRLETATGRSAAIKAVKKHGAPTTIDLEALLEEPPAKRRKWIQDSTDRKLTDRVSKVLKEADTLDDLHAALLSVIDAAATPDLVPRGAMVLQPSEERRKSGSHYTPRSLTEPIVRTTLEPILTRLRGDNDRPPRPELLLDLKVCDPAMGSGAFLVEACRQLGDALVESWRAHDKLPEIPPDEDEVIFARRLIAQRCLYGVDRNPVAVDLAKMSLWLVTLARDHALTFVDHALRHGDSLVGLSRHQIEAFHWKVDEPRFQAGFEAMRVREHVEKAAELRQQIREADDSVPDWELRHLWNDAQDELDQVRLFGDLVLAAFFEGSRTKEREARRAEYARVVTSGETDQYRDWLEERRNADQPLVPFHWEIEFPEVFQRDNPGFNGFIGNPPFLWGNRISRLLGDPMRDWLLDMHAGAHGNGDLVAHFLRRCFLLLRSGGHLGLVTTNSISEADTRVTGLDWILDNGGTVYAANRDEQWPGISSVRVSHVFVVRGAWEGACRLDGELAGEIGSDLREKTVDWRAVALVEQEGKSFKGVDFGGTGFLITEEARESILTRSPREARYISPVLNARDLMNSSDLRSGGYIINFTGLSLAEAEQATECMAVVKRFVLPKRMKDKRRAYRERWWLFNEARTGLYAAIAGMPRVLVGPVVSKHLAFAFLDPTTVFTNALNVFVFDSYGAFAVLQSRVHEAWALRHGSSLRTDPRYNPTDCFETFPFPERWASQRTLVAAGEAYYEARTNVMAGWDEGLTKTYNRFHDPDERNPEPEKLRELHSAMDRTVLAAYGWSDIPTDSKFLLDYEIDEEEWSPRKKKPYRYRWPDEVRDEVLARLLELNAERAAEEARSGAAAGTTKTGRKKAAKRASEAPETEDLFS